MTFTSQEQQLLLQQYKEFNITLVSFNDYLKIAEEFHRTHLAKVDTMRAYLQACQKDIAQLYTKIKAMPVQEEEGEK